MIHVTRAIILRDNCVLAAQRPHTMSLPLLWELPGGKMEAGEDFATCLSRETWEETRLEIEIQHALPAVDRFFRDKHYRMLPFVCAVTSGTPQAIEHAQVIWQPIDQLFELEWGPAEGQLLQAWMKIRAEKLLEATPV